MYLSDNLWSEDMKMFLCKLPREKKWTSMSQIIFPKSYIVSNLEIPTEY